MKIVFGQQARARNGLRFDIQQARIDGELKRNKFLGFNGVYGFVGEEKRREEEGKRERKYLEMKKE